MHVRVIYSIGDAANTVAFATRCIDRLPGMKFSLGSNMMVMLRVSPWTGNWLGVCCPTAVYPRAYGLSKVLPPTMEEALSSAPVHEYHEAEQWLQAVNIKTNNCLPCFVSSEYFAGLQAKRSLLGR